MTKNLIISTFKIPTEECQMFTLVLIRHGGSKWNIENRFQGWADIDLSEKGYKEANRAGNLLKKNGFTFDISFTSFLKRAIKTNTIILEVLDLLYIPVYKHWRLNERHYGALMGQNKDDMRKKVGKEQVRKWRRSFDISPPALEESDERHPKYDPKYKMLPHELLPKTESIKLAIERIMPFWEIKIMPEILYGKKVLVTAHGSTLRAIMKYLDKMDGEKIAKVEIPTGIPLVYELDKNLSPIKKYYLDADLQ